MPTMYSGYYARQSPDCQASGPEASQTRCPPSSASHCTPWRPRPTSVRSKPRVALDSTPAQHATTPASRPRCGRRSRPFPWCIYRARIWRSTMRCCPEVCAGDAAEHGVDDVAEAVRPGDGGRGVGAATDAGGHHDALPVLLEVFEAETEARRRQRPGLTGYAGPRVCRPARRSRRSTRVRRGPRSCSS